MAVVKASVVCLLAHERYTTVSAFWSAAAAVATGRQAVLQTQAEPGSGCSSVHNYDMLLLEPLAVRHTVVNAEKGF
jgi:hypothetical protein